MTSACTARIAVFGVAAACTTGSRAHVLPTAPSRAEVAARHRSNRQAEIAALNARAGNRVDDELWPSQRCGAAFELFTKYIELGMSAPEVAAVLTDLSWITHEAPYVPTRAVPVTIDSKRATLVVHCLGQNDVFSGLPDAEHFIYLQVSDPTVSSLTEFIAAGPDVALQEYVLEYPDMSFTVVDRDGQRRIP